MITVDLEPEELDGLIAFMQLTLIRMPGWGASVSEMKALLARIEYLEGLK